MVGPAEAGRRFQPRFPLIRGELEVFYWKTSPHNRKDEAGKKRSAAGKRSSGERRRRRKINERVCCDSRGRGAAIITIHQDNEWGFQRAVIRI